MNRSPNRLRALAAFAAVVALALGLVRKAPSAQGGAQEATSNPPILLLHRSSVPARQQGMAGAALRDAAARVRENHAAFWSMSAYLPAFFEGDMIVHVFGAAKDGATMQAAFQRYSADDEWQRRMSAYMQQTSADLTNEILLPVAGRALSEPAMIRSWRVARARQDKFAEALTLATKLVEHVNASHADAALSLYVQDVGDFGTLHWIEDYGGIAHWAELKSRLLRDPAFLALQDELNALLVEGSIQTEMLENYAL